MTEILGYIGVALSPGNLFFALIGTVLGIIVGALPGFTPTMGIAVLIPVTYTIDPTTALCFSARFIVVPCSADPLLQS